MLQRRADAGLGTNHAPDVFDPSSAPMEEPIPGQHRGSELFNPEIKDSITQFSGGGMRAGYGRSADAALW